MPLDLGWSESGTVTPFLLDAEMRLQVVLALLGFDSVMPLAAGW